jgi:hypothetical protein
LFHVGFMLGLFFDPEDGGDMLLKNIVSLWTELFVTTGVRTSNPIDIVDSMGTLYSASHSCLWPLGAGRNFSGGEGKIEYLLTNLSFSRLRLLILLFAVQYPTYKNIFFKSFWFLVLSRVAVTLDGVWIGDLIYWPLIHSQLVTTLYRSLSHTDWCPRSVTVSTSRFLATDFNTGTITVSLNYTLHISHIKSSLHSRTFNWALLQLSLTIFFELPYRTDLVAPVVSVITSRHGPTENTALIFFRAYMLRELRSNGHCLQSRRLATGLHATLLIFGIFPPPFSSILLFFPRI